eukprot:SAG25_NODE_5358_length_668_cov_0.862917_2_plen_99_part_01
MAPLLLPSPPPPPVKGVRRSFVGVSVSFVIMLLPLLPLLLVLLSAEKVTAGDPPAPAPPPSRDVRAAPFPGEERAWIDSIIAGSLVLSGALTLPQHAMR